ncbi:Ig domain-containing protein [Parabacteroides sp. ZJ-118]|uniref:Ig-like domain-containing protein n=1 Tax=Parabacteroides sp. ZJ-118 TaxID=2709398 RepID=UPI00351B081D
MDKQTLSLEIGQSEQLFVTSDAEENANRTLVWHSSNESIEKKEGWLVLPLFCFLL